MGRNTRLLIGLVAVVAILATVLFFNRDGESDPSRPPLPETTAPEPPPDNVVLAADFPLEEAAPERAEVEPTAPPAHANDTVVTIRVLLAEDRSPVVGVRAEPLLTEEVHAGDDRDLRITNEEGIARLHLTRGTTLDGVKVDAGPTTTSRWERRKIPVATGSEEVVTVEVSSGATVAGTVVDLDGRPVARAVVRGWCTYPWILNSGRRTDPDRETIADDAGRFSVPHLGRRFVLEPAAEGMACRATVHGELEPGDDVEGVELVLGPAARIEGRVIDPSGRPLPEVEIETMQSWGYGPSLDGDHPGVLRAGPARVKTTSAADGSFLLADLAPWRYGIEVDHPGFDRWTGKHAPADGFLEIRLGSGVTLTGRILDAEGDPLPGAEVRLRQDRATTDERGSFRLVGLEPDRFGVLYVQAAAHAVLVHQPLELRNDAPNDIELRLERESVLAGRVVDTEGGGVANALVEIDGDRIVDFGPGHMTPIPTWERRHRVHETRTDDDGSFRLDRLYDGTFRITATHPHDPELMAVDTVVSGREDLELVLDPDAVVGVTLFGGVTDATTGLPVPRFQVWPWSMDPRWGPPIQETFTDEEGVYELGGLVPVEIRVWFDADGYCRTMIPAHEYAAGRHELDAALYPKRDLHVRVVDPDGNPFAGVHVWFKTEAGESIWYDAAGSGWNWTHRLDPNGELKFSGLQAAPLTFVVGGTLGAEESRFPIDLRIEPKGVQQFVVDAPRPAHLDLFLMGGTSAPEVGQVLVIEDVEEYAKYIGEREDLRPLDAPRFEVIVRAAGEVRSRVEATTEDGREWMVYMREGDTGFTSNAFQPSVQFAVPHDDLDVEIVAEGYRAFHFSLADHEITRPGVTALRRIVFLQKEP